MRRSFLTSLLAFAAPCLVAGVLPSCATNDSMMFIEGVALRKSGACVVTPDLNGTFLDQGVMDRTLAKEYVAALIVGNQLTQRGSRERLRTETSRVALKGAEVKLETPQGEAVIADTPKGKKAVEPFSSIGTGFVDASDGTQASAAAMFVTLIPSSLTPTLPRGVLVAKVRVFGTTLGGEDVESSELPFPIKICDGCLIDFPASSRDLAVDGTDYQCKLATDDTAASTTTSSKDAPCSAGIDFPVDCTVCSGLYAACASPATNCSVTPASCSTP